MSTLDLFQQYGVQGRYPAFTEQGDDGLRDVMFVLLAKSGILEEPRHPLVCISLAPKLVYPYLKKRLLDLLMIGNY